MSFSEAISFSIWFYKENGLFTFGYTTASAKVINVIKGDYTKNTITLENMYCVLEDENTFVTFSDLKPFEKGDKFIYCLKKDESRNAYCIYGDYSAIFPYNYDKASSITSIYNESIDYLSNKETISIDEIDSYKDTHTIFRSVKNKIYALTNDEALEIRAITTKLENIKNEINKKDFGIDDFNHYDLMLYAEFISEFDLNKIYEL